MLRLTIGHWTRLLGLTAALLTSATGAAPVVVASIAPLHSLVSAVMAGGDPPKLLLPAGASPHSFSLRPSDARLLSRADVLFWIGPELELPLQRILSTLRPRHVVAMLEVPGIERLPLRELHTGDDHAHADAPGARRQAAVDPHIWLSPANAVAMVGRIAETLGRIDADNAPRYRANAAAARQRILETDRQLRDRLSGIDVRYAVFHDAYQYFEHAYGLQSADVVTTHPERRPGAARLHHLRSELARKGIRCLFSEPQFEPGLVDVLSEDLGIRHAVIDSLGTRITPGPDAYPALMRAIADTLIDCLEDHHEP